MELHGWRRGHTKRTSVERRICLVALIVCVLLLIAVAALRSFTGDSLAASPPLSINLPTWAATGWNAQSVASWIEVVPHKSTFTETLFSLPLFIGWGIHNHPVWGMPLLFCGALILLGLWRLAAQVLGARKPSVFFPALIMLQCAAISWGWTFFVPSPYLLKTRLFVIDMKSTSETILSPTQQTFWHQRNGYNGFVLEKTNVHQDRIQSPYMLFVHPETAQSFTTQLSQNSAWWVFYDTARNSLLPESMFTETQLKEQWKSGKVAAVSLQDPPISAWEHLPAASLVNLFLSLLALLLVAVLWGLQPPHAPLSAPGRVADFLQKNRRLKRWGGMAMMVLTFIGTLLALWLTFYPAWGFVRLETLPLTTTALLCVALDYCYWLGRKSWQKTH
jgi:hypothetical protein